VKTIKITGVEVNVENPHSDETNLRCRDASTVITRRGRSIVLRINFSIQLTIAYTITTTFIPVYGPKERSSTFRGTGNGNGQSKLFLSIEIPSNFPIGHYDLYVTISLRGHPEVLMYTLHSALVILFNSSHPEDDVYIDFEDKNYVLKNVGVIWRGTDSQPLPISWEYGQYQLLCLDVALSLLKNLSANKRRSAVYVAQAILSHISPSDGNGILSIPSNGRYMGGVYPSKWSSSVPIIQRYYHTKRPVKLAMYQ
jgi:transglutaminase 1